MSGGESGVFRAELGRAPTAQTLGGISIEVLRLYGYEIELADADLVQTGWRYLPYGVRDRIAVTIRPRGNDIYNGSLRVVVEEQDDGGTWRAADPSAELTDQYADLRRETRRRLQRFMTQN